MEKKKLAIAAVAFVALYIIFAAPLADFLEWHINSLAKAEWRNRACSSHADCMPAMQFSPTYPNPRTCSARLWSAPQDSLLAKLPFFQTEYFFYYIAGIRDFRSLGYSCHTGEPTNSFGCFAGKCQTCRNPPHHSEYEGYCALEPQVICSVASGKCHKTDDCPEEFFPPYAKSRGYCCQDKDCKPYHENGMIACLTPEEVNDSDGYHQGAVWAENASVACTCYTKTSYYERSCSFYCLNDSDCIEYDQQHNGSGSYSAYCFSSAAVKAISLPPHIVKSEFNTCRCRHNACELGPLPEWMIKAYAYPWQD